MGQKPIAICRRQIEEVFEGREWNRRGFWRKGMEGRKKGKLVLVLSSSSGPKRRLKGELRERI